MTMYIHSHTDFYLLQLTTRISFIGYNSQVLHCKNKIVKMTNVLVSTAVKNSRKCNLIVHVGCYDYMHGDLHVLVQIIIQRL